MKLSPTQRAYIAGFLDGDGSVYVRAKPNDSYRYGYQIAPSIVLFQSSKSKEALKRLHAMLQLGYIRERNDGILELIINKVAEIQEFIVIAKPFSLFKKKQLALMEKIIEAKKKIKNECDFQAMLKLVDIYRVLNYSKKRKIRP
ncbi:MAG: hypothetical protein A3J06_00355 [Candidatus Moranbacteria bacterium RIFCSPLOWO2_02_FULL_48_19]|nr:MAG: hypothetical protein A3J06_00355 [Candidatus Moranbacteria bacterium RIFCSPLOWO2_02_FULL_48_19]OGI30494.1 MAG: hypothetical protein A3G09_00910 [Candidatus Moranbacteria bacterium RIFCSPLOWO2_12_FULL_48_12]HLC00130.1 LAGLIDADG family homing endonuclease [Candidatus Bathyarchaeia archaeon]